VCAKEVATMSVSRREFMGKGALAAGAGVAVAGCVKTGKGAPAKPVMIAACGLACEACPVMKAGKCKGCGPAKSVPSAMVTKKNCPVLTCANKKGIDYCGRDCPGFTKCKKMIGRPYNQSYMDMIAKRLG